MIAGAAFDIYAGQFTAGETAQILGVNRPVIDMMIKRGQIEPARREQSKPLGTGRAARKKTRRGRLLFSARDIFEIRLMRLLTEQLGSDLAHSGSIATAAKNGKISSKLVASHVSGTTEIAHAMAKTGEWMWAAARSIERGEPILIYAYAARPNRDWIFDMHLGSPSEPPFFGWQIPHVYVPMSEIFGNVYRDCKELLGLSGSSSIVS